MPKPCPQSVIQAGANFVNLRHYLEDGEKLFAAAIDGLEATQKDLKEAGLKRMQYGVALANLHEARRAAGLVMAAHEHMARALGEIDMATPTDAQILPLLKDARDWR